MDVELRYLCVMRGFKENQNKKSTFAVLVCCARVLSLRLVTAHGVEGSNESSKDLPVDDVFTRHREALRSVNMGLAGSGVGDVRHSG